MRIVKHGYNVGLPQELIISKVFGLLTGAAPQILLIFYAKRQFTKRKGRSDKRKGNYICTNLDQLTFTYIEAFRDHGIQKARFLRAIEQLVRFGFIDIMHAGGCLQGDASIYRISDRWSKFGTDDFVSAEREKDKRGVGYRNRERVG